MRRPSPRCWRTHCAPLRARRRRRSAVWAPGAPSPAAPRRGPAALGASRLAARLTARGLPAAARGRLAWLRARRPSRGGGRRRRGARPGALDVPLVAVLAGPRSEVLEGLLARAGPRRRRHARAGRAARAARGRHARRRRRSPARRCAPGPPRWLALAGLAGARALDGPVRGLVRELRGTARRRARPRGDRVAQPRAGRRRSCSSAASRACSSARSCSARSSRAVGREGAAQRAADLSALAGARAMHEAYPRLFEPARDRRPPEPVAPRAGRVPRARARRRGAGRRGATARTPTTVAFPDGASFAPVRIRVTVRERVDVERGRARRAARVGAGAEAELGAAGRRTACRRGRRLRRPASRCRQGKPMRPDVAQAFDRMERAARADGVALLITSAYRSDAEQAVLWRAPSRPALGRAARRVAAPLRHRARPRPARGVRLARGQRGRVPLRPALPARAVALRLRAERRARRRATAAEASRRRPRPGARCPSFVPARFAPLLARAAQRWNVSAALLAAQLYAESNFNPFAVSPTGAQGIAQFMPETARGDGPRRPVRRRARRSTRRRS